MPSRGFTRGPGDSYTTSPIPRFAAEAAARQVPLKRQGAVSLLTHAEPRVHPRTRYTTSPIPRFAAEAAARRVPLKRQGAVSLLTQAESRVHPRTREADRGTLYDITHASDSRLNITHASIRG